jgi:hypothetical protein
MLPIYNDGVAIVINLKKPIKYKKNKASYPSSLYKPNFIHQIDLLFLPYNEDNQHRYASDSVVIDMSSRLIDAEASETKNSKSVTEAIKKIYKRGLSKQPTQIDSDSGSEFKGEFESYLKQKNIKHKVALPNKHSKLLSQKMQIIESLNHYLKEC